MTQDEAFTVCTLGKSVFLTGAAGTGKTHVLNRYIGWLRERGIVPAVTASTGIAATHIGGQTIHSWSGIGVKDYLGSYELDRIEQNERLVKRFRSTRVLIIDEVSMLSANTLSLVDQAIRAGLQSNEVMGGMQVVLCGDFFQLPPVVRNGGTVAFAFQSDVWHMLGLHVCYLTKQFRQDDETLLALLSAMRAGEVSQELDAALRERVGHEVPDTIPHLYTHNVDVDQLNNTRLADLPGAPHNYEMRSKGTKKHIEILKRGMVVRELLQLKKDAVVMFVKNDLKGAYVNGTLGTVVDFSPMGDPIVRTHDERTITVQEESWKLEDGEKVRAELVQIPLRLAWAVTVHKSQGMTLDAARIDLRKAFVAGQGYVALSRLRSLEGLYLDGTNDLSYSRHPAVAEADDHLLRASASIERRLKKTSQDRVQTLAGAFVTALGGHPPSKKGVRSVSKQKKSTYEKTLALLKEHRTLEEIHDARGVTLDTVLSHVEYLLKTGQLESEALSYLLPADGAYEDVLNEIRDTFATEGAWKLSPVHKRLKSAYTFSELRFARLFLCPWHEQ